MSEMKYKETWGGTYEEIYYEISCHAKSSENHHGIWCYYIYLRADKLNIPSQPKEWKPRWKGDCWEECWVQNNLYNVDFHGGITYVGFCNKDILKVGCDYNHSWDQELLDLYNENWLLNDCKLTIDIFLCKYPEYLEKETNDE